MMTDENDVIYDFPTLNQSYRHCNAPPHPPHPGFTNHVVSYQAAFSDYLGRDKSRLFCIYIM